MENKCETICFATDDRAEFERILNFLRGSSTAEETASAATDDVKAKIEALTKERDDLKAELDATKGCLEKVNYELDRVARERDEARCKLEGAQKLLSQEAKKNGSVVAESFNIITGILAADGCDVSRLMDRAAALYVLKNLR